MAFEQFLNKDVPMTASPNSAGIPQFTAVVIDTAGGANIGDCILATGNTAPIFGVNQSVGSAPAVNGTYGNVTAGQSMAVRIEGVTKLQAAGAITAGQYVSCNGSGQASAVTSLNPATTPTTTYVIGQALTAATGAGDLVSVLLRPALSTLATS